MAAKYNLSKVETHILDPAPDLSVYQSIKKFLKDEASDITKHGYIDFVACGNVGANFNSDNDRRMLGSVANSILRARKMNVIFVP